MYLNEAIGYDCAGHSMSVTWPWVILEEPSLSATFTLGATLPTGSIIIYQINILLRLCQIITEKIWNVGIGCNFRWGGHILMSGSRFLNYQINKSLYVLVWKYLKEAIGYDCAGHSKSVTWPCLILNIRLLSATLTLGATLPTGSV